MRADDLREIFRALGAYLSGSLSLPDSHLVTMCICYEEGDDTLKFPATVEAIEGAIGLFASGSITETELHANLFRQYLFLQYHFPTQAAETGTSSVVMMGDLQIIG